MTSNDDKPGDDGVNHPSYYGGADNPYEPIKVVDAWNLNFEVGSAVVYLARAGKKPGEPYLKDLKKARWFIDHEIKRMEALEAAASAGKAG